MHSLIFFIIVYLLSFVLGIVLFPYSVFLQDELADVLVTLFDSRNRLAPFLTRILNTEVYTFALFIQRHTILLYNPTSMVGAK